jgi:hypothetical protein
MRRLLRYMGADPVEVLTVRGRATVTTTGDIVEVPPPEESRLLGQGGDLWKPAPPTTPDEAKVWPEVS